MNLVVVYTHCGPDTVTFIEHESKEKFLEDFSTGIDEYYAHFAMLKTLANNIKAASDTKDPDRIELARSAYQEFSNLHRLRQSGVIVDGVGYPVYETWTEHSSKPIRLPDVYTVDEWFENNCKKSFSVLGRY